MSLGKKVAIVAILLGLFFSLGTFIALKLTVLPAFGEIEVDGVEKDRARVSSAVSADERALEAFAIEYANWTATYRYARGEYPAFEGEELLPEYWISTGINLMLIYNRKGELIYAWMKHPGQREELVPHKELPFQLEGNGGDWPDLEVLKTARGLVRTSSGLLQVISLPILDSAGRGPAEGFMLTGRFYTDQRITEVARQVTADLTIYYDLGDSAPPEVTLTIDRLADGVEPFRLVVDQGYVHLYDLIRDIRGDIVGVLQMSTERRISQIGAATIRLATTVIAIASACFLLFALAFMHYRIVSPLKQMTALFQRMRRTGNLEVIVDTGRSDEVGVLSREFAELTEKLSVAHAELEEARDEAVAMSTAKSDFLARMSHEIRTPMNGVLGMTELLRTTPLSDKQQRFVRTIYESGSTLLALINDILDFSKIEAGKLKVESLGVDLRRLVEEAVESFAEPASRKGIELVSVVDAEAETNVVTDPTRLRQVIVNLLGNALKFTETGEIVVRLDTETVGDTIRARFEVRDTGIGIREENQRAIFESFTQEDGTTTRVYGGTGLGLTISRQLVELLGGKLELESTFGTGSSFFFTLPLSPDHDYDARKREVRTVAGRRILVVDDNATNREILENHLESWRASVVSTASAEEALATLDGAEEAFDVAILDWHMPGTDGVGLARQIREREAAYKMRIMMLSSVASSLPKETMDELCISTQIAKPVRQGDLFDALLNTLADGGEAPAPVRQAPGADRKLEGRVLLAEDNVVNQAVAVGMLTNLGLEVEVAENGEVAAQKLAESNYDVVLMDCQMPVLDGFEATRRIRAWELESFERPTAIVALTANALKGDREKCLAAGMNDYLAKPFTAEELFSVLSLWVGREPTPAEAANDESEAPESAA